MHDNLKYLDLYDAAFSEQHLNPDEPDDLEGNGNHIHVGAKQHPCTFEDLDDSCHNDVAYTNFWTCLAKFFNTVLEPEALPNGQRLVLQQHDKVKHFFTSFKVETYRSIDMRIPISQS